MKRKSIFESERLIFSIWEATDTNKAAELWTDERVTKYIGGPFDISYVKTRLKAEMENYKKYKVQYFPVFTKNDGEFIGCIGLRPRIWEGRELLEAGIHLMVKSQGKGFGYEGLKRAVEYAQEIGSKTLCAGHHPENRASEGLLLKVGFKKVGTVFYEPTGLLHPFYLMETTS